MLHLTKDFYLKKVILKFWISNFCFLPLNKNATYNKTKKSTTFIHIDITITYKYMNRTAGQQLHLLFSCPKPQYEKPWTRYEHQHRMIHTVFKEPRFAKMDHYYFLYQELWYN